MPLVIKRRVSMDFLGEEYKEAYLTFRSISVSEYEKLSKDLPDTTPEMQDLAQRVTDGTITSEEQVRLNELYEEKGIDSSSSVKTILKYLKEHFISGKFPDDSGELQDVTKEDLDGIDAEVALKCFQALTGQADPKV